MLKKKYYDGFIVHDILNKHLDDGHKILEILTAFADADGVDAVEVVRCKDCIWNREKEWVDCYMSGMHGRNTNNFCSLGERKDDEN